MARRIRWYVPQRQRLPDIASSMSASVGFGFLARRSAADMSWPGWQYPHWDTCSAAHMCTDNGTQSCGNYICSGSACKTTCASTADCAPPYICSAGMCK